MSASVGSIKNAGPSFHGLVRRSPTTQVVPDDPAVVREVAGADRGVILRRAGRRRADARVGRTTCPWGSANPGRDGRIGPASRTFRPPASQTMVTTSFGGVGGPAGRASFIGWPSIGWKPSKCRSFAAVGAMPARVTGRFTSCPRGDEPRPVPEHRHVLDVVPRTHVRQSRADEVRLLRDVGELRAAVGAPAAPRPQQELVRDRARQVHQVLVARLGARRSAAAP